MMLQHIFETGDGSHSILIPQWNVCYHSKHGAVQESRHIFIEAGLKPALKNKNHLTIFEMGFGTGLNALLTLMETESLPVKVFYETVETEPLDPTISSSLNFTSALNRPEMQQQFMDLHRSDWNRVIDISANFRLYKRSEDVSDVVLSTAYDLVYFDAFDPVMQPGIWSTKIFLKIFDAMNKGGILVTFSSKGAVRRALVDAGFFVEKLPGPAGKREITTAKKI